MRSKNQKKLLAASAAYIMGLGPQVKISGNNSTVSVFSEVLKSSKDLYNILKEDKEGQLQEKIDSKRDASQKFYSEFGWNWPL
jgi:hypothetical protein